MILEHIDDIKDYQLIYADPPWNQSKGGKKKARKNSSGTPLDYKVMPMEKIEEHLRIVTESSEPNAIMFMWTIDKYLYEAEQMALRIGWKLHARMIWNKVIGIPAAFTIRYGHEYLLYMYRGKFTPVDVSERGKIHSVFTEKSTKHSKKPIAAYNIIERLYPELRKVELYARNQRDGWDCWGNEVGGYYD